MKNDVTIGMNRTGIATSPIDAKAAIEGAVDGLTTSTEAGEAILSQAHGEFIQEAEGVGSLPPPTTLKGAAKALVDRIKGSRLTVLLDKMGERLAFERSGTRLYDAFLSKLAAAGALPTGPSIEEAREIREEEHAHMLMLADAMKSLGGDPTAITPCADLVGVAGMGLLQAMSDPRTNILQGLEVLLTAELTDNDSWTMLASLAEEMGHHDFAKQAREALLVEETHLARVRTWLIEGTRALAQPREAAE